MTSMKIYNIDTKWYHWVAAVWYFISIMLMLIVHNHSFYYPGSAFCAVIFALYFDFRHESKREKNED